ncbi:MAG: rRNA maturation RNase YbeY [Gammaproteobacteria bacterium]
MHPGVSTDAAAFSPTERELQRWVQAALKVADASSSWQVAICLMDERQMQELNGSFRNKMHPTNCLSFPAYSPDEVAVMLKQVPCSAGNDNMTDSLGDIALCSSVINKESGCWELPLAAHWAHLTIHSVLHLLGYDHLMPEERKNMEAAETRAMLELGFADPWSDRPDRPDRSNRSDKSDRSGAGSQQRFELHGP